ncbi:MAG TPA: hypothetical protein VJ623_12625 [Holophagaceae bacterium]|nr:hypothetical protein [Holophagaceae bacterium]HJW33919.1 hypothetical protein [Holophagaceae bacterium]
MATDEPTPAEGALQLLFKKLHPHLEDAAHAHERKAPKADLEKLHARLQKARFAVVEALDAIMEPLPEEDPLREELEGLSANLTPLGEPYRQSLIVTQLCLEEAPAELLPYAPPGCVGTSTWGPRMVAFLGKLEDPAFQARRRWAWIPEDVGETEEG